jgi:hypothetical protein
MAASLLLCAAALPASSAVHPDIVLSAVKTVTPAPGEFATLSCQAEYRPDAASAPCRLLVRFRAPPGWRAVSTERTIGVEPGGTLVVPFTAWVPQQASSDSLHLAKFSLFSLPDTSLLASVESGFQVQTTYGATLVASTPTLDVPAGEKTRLIVAVQNTGNRADTFRLETESAPSWSIVLDSTKVVVPAGGTVPVTVTVTVPAGAQAGTTRVLGVAAVSEGAQRLGLERQPGERVEVRVTATARKEDVSRYARLPVDAAISAGEAAPGQSQLGLRFNSSGQVGLATAVQLEADLASGSRVGAGSAWQNQLLRARVTRAAWDVAAGDVNGEFSDLSTAAISGRGIGLIVKREAWTARALGVRNRGLGRTQSWGMGLTRALSSGPEIGGDLVYRQEPVGRSSIRSDRLLSLTSRWDAPHKLRLSGDLAFSATNLAGGARSGQAIQLAADHAGRPVQLRARAYTGSAGFGGRIRDRDGLLLYGAYVPALRPLRCWTHLETTRGRSWSTGSSPLATTTRYRTGVRWEPPGWPSFELNAGGLDDRSVLGDNVRSVASQDAGITTSWSRDRFLAVATARYGGVRDRTTGRSGPIRSAELSAGGGVRDWRMALHWNLDRDWASTTDAFSTTHSLTADVAWTAPSDRFTAGIGVSSRRTKAERAAGSNQAEFRLQPRAEYRLGAKLRLQLDAFIADLDGSTRVDRWQISLGYASDGVLPVPWVPVRGGVHGVAFLDTDGDGEPDVGEKRVDGLVLQVDGHHQVTDRDGAFEWPALDPGTFLLDLDRASIPAGLVVSVTLPLEVRVEAGEDMPVNIPLLPSGEASGIIFLDDNHDGVQAARETGVPDMRVTAWRDGRQVADGITDGRGRFHLRGLPVGAYELRIDPAWLPDGWSPSSAEPAEFSITPARHLNLTPYGIGPKKKRMIITYPGSHAPETQDAAPPLAPGTSPSEPAPPPKLESVPGSTPAPQPKEAPAAPEAAPEPKLEPVPERKPAPQPKEAPASPETAPEPKLEPVPEPAPPPKQQAVEEPAPPPKEHQASEPATEPKPEAVPGPPKDPVVPERAPQPKEGTVLEPVTAPEMKLEPVPEPTPPPKLQAVVEPAPPPKEHQASEPATEPKLEAVPEPAPPPQQGTVLEPVTAPELQLTAVLEPTPAPQCTEGPVPERSSEPELEAVPEPGPAPQLQSGCVSEPMPAPQFAGESAPEPAPQPQLELVPKPAPRPKLEPVPEPTSAPQLAEEPVPEPGPELQPEAVPAPEATPQPKGQQAPEPAPQPQLASAPASPRAPEPPRQLPLVPAPQPKPAMRPKQEPVPVPRPAPQPWLEPVSELKPPPRLNEPRGSEPAPPPTLGPVPEPALDPSRYHSTRRSQTRSRTGRAGHGPARSPP